MSDNEPAISGFKTAGFNHSPPSVSNIRALCGLGVRLWQVSFPLTRIFWTPNADEIDMRHDWGSQYISHDFQAELLFLRMKSSPAFACGPEGSGCVKRSSVAGGAVAIGAHSLKRGRVAVCAARISRALHSVDSRTHRLPHAARGSAAALYTRSCCMNTLSSLSNKLGALQKESWG